MKPNGDPLAQWDLRGKADGDTADPVTGVIIATVNEDADSSLYPINPNATSPASAVRTMPTTSRSPTWEGRTRSRSTEVRS